VTFQNAARVSGVACQTLARFTTGDTALVECPAGEGRALVFASDSQQPVERFSAARDVRAVRARGRALSRQRAGAYGRLSDRGRAGRRQARPGIASVIDAAGGARTIAVNVDPRESDPARLSIDDFQSAVTRLKDAASRETRGEARQQEDQQHLWQYALAAMAVLLAAEGVLCGTDSVMNSELRIKNSELIGELLNRVRRRWRALMALRAFVRGALLAAVAVGAALFARGGPPARRSR